MFTKLLLFFLLTSSYLSSQELIKIDTREGIKQRFILNEAINENKAIAILFAGGNGKLKLHKKEELWSTKNFLIRSREIFNKYNITTISVDSPSGMKKGMNDGFRTSKEHLKDISKVIQYIKNKYPNKPIYLIGTSMGTISATYNSIYNKDINGVILTSSVTKTNRNTKPVTQLDLEQISIPTLIIHHKDDSCRVTPIEGSKEIFNKLINVNQKELKIFSGGYEKGNPCKSQSYHGFLGIEEDVIKHISNWIKSH